MGEAFFLPKHLHRVHIGRRPVQKPQVFREHRCGGRTEIKGHVVFPGLQRNRIQRQQIIIQRHGIVIGDESRCPFSGFPIIEPLVPVPLYAISVLIKRHPACHVFFRIEVTEKGGLDRFRMIDRLGQDIILQDRVLCQQDFHLHRMHARCGQIRFLRKGVKIRPAGFQPSFHRFRGDSLAVHSQSQRIGIHRLGSHVPDFGNHFFLRQFQSVYRRRDGIHGQVHWRHGTEDGFIQEIFRFHHFEHILHTGLECKIIAPVLPVAGKRDTVIEGHHARNHEIVRSRIDGYRNGFASQNEPA